MKNTNNSKMKKTACFLLLGFFSVTTLSAQYVLQDSICRFRAGDKLTKQEVRFKDPGRSDKDVLWDFSKLEPVMKKKYILTRPMEEISYHDDISKYVREVNDNRSLVSYWEDETSGRIASSENGSIYRYNDSGDSLLVWGYEIPTTKVENTQPELWLTFPFRFKDKLVSYYNGEGVYCDRLDVNVMGSIEVEADAYGMMITPDKDTLTNVLRVRTLKTTLDDLEPLFLKKNGKPAKVKGDSIAYALKKNKNASLKTEIIRWYAEGYRYPVFETWHSYTDKEGKKSDENRQAFFYDPVEQEEEYLQTDSVNQAILADNRMKKEKKKSAAQLRSSTNPTGNNLPVTVQRYNIYPNPTDRDLQVEVYLLEETSVKFALYSLQGKAVYQTTGSRQSGVCQETIPMATLPQGNYILSIVCGGKVISEKIIKK